MILNLFLIGFPTSCHNFSSNFFIELSSDSVAIAGGGILLGFFYRVSEFSVSNRLLPTIQSIQTCRVEVPFRFEFHQVSIDEYRFFLLPSFTEFFFLQFFKFFFTRATFTATAPNNWIVTGRSNSINCQ